MWSEAVVAQEESRRVEREGREDREEEKQRALKAQGRASGSTRHLHSMHLGGARRWGGV